ncbi:unnamed protein product, partial [Prorocentrum cordatum]
PPPPPEDAAGVSGASAGPPGAAPPPSPLSSSRAEQGGRLPPRLRTESFPGPKGPPAMAGIMAVGETGVAVGSWMVCSIGMMLFNKFAIKAFPVECTLVALQMFVSVLAMVCFCFRGIHIGSARDVLRWSMVAPFFTGMLLSSILALKFAPMSLVVVFRTLSPLLSLLIERMYPDPLRISAPMLGSIFTM